MVDPNCLYLYLVFLTKQVCIFAWVLGQNYIISAVLAALNIKWGEDKFITHATMQAFVDDIAAVQYEATFIKRMFESNENVMNLAGLEVKLSKCAVMYVWRSGNNWYNGKNDKKPEITVQDCRIKGYVFMIESITINTLANHYHCQVRIGSKCQNL